VSSVGVDLLEQSIDYALGSIAAVEPSMLHRPTPCSEWDLHDLLFHLADSMLTLGELLGGSVAAVSGCGPVTRAADAALDLRRRIASTDVTVSTRTIDGVCIPRHLVIVTGALEIAIHGWDVEQASDHPKPIPARLAQGLLPHAPRLLDRAIRRDLFDAPIELSCAATASDRLVASAGRASGSLAMSGSKLESK
jgi:uncharacterized protein (TIGR03086 family)